MLTTHLRVTASEFKASVLQGSRLTVGLTDQVLVLEGNSGRVLQRLPPPRAPPRVVRALCFLHTPGQRDPELLLLWDDVISCLAIMRN